MNAQFQVAQLSGSTTSGSNAAPTRIFRLSKPLGDQAVVVNLGYDQKAKVDFSAIANEKITLVHVGDKLIILFDNKSTVTVEPFFDSRHDALGNLSVEVAPGREVSVNEFASLFPITTDQSVLPAAGEGGNAQGSGAYFSDSAVDPLASRNPLDLLGQEELGNFRLTPETFAGVPDNNLAPSGSFTISGALLVHDETIGVQPMTNDQANPLPAVFQQAGLIGWAESAAPIIASATFDFGSNGPGSVAYVLTTAAGGAFNGVDSGLQATATGNHIFLFTEGPLVVAREGNGATPNAGGAIAFELYLDPVTLKLSVAQYEAIQHSNALDPNDRTDLADVVFVQQVVTDGQGIVVTEVSTSPVGVAFDDDGPAIQVTVAESDREGPTGLETLVLDESTGNDPHGVFPHGTVDDTGFTAPDPTGTNPIGRLETSAGGEEQGQGTLQALFNVVKDPGTDGEKSTAYQYSFTLTGGSGPSGSVATTLEVTDANNLYFDDTIYLFKVSDTEIVGHVGNDPNGPIAIRITLVNADSLSGGQLVVEQYMAIDHGQDGNNFDSSKWLTLLGGGEQGAASLGVTLTATITDGDNDTATSSATILIAGNGESSSIVFQDDGPVLVGDKVVIAVVDEDGLPGHNVDAGRPGEVAGTGSAIATGSLASLVDFGTDGAGANAFHLATLVAPVDTGLTSKGGHVLIVSDGTTLHGYVESGNGSGFTAGDREIFTLTVGPDGSYTFTLKDQVDHPTLNNAAGDNSENPLAATLDLSSFIVATDGDGDFVNLASGTFKVDVQDDIPILTSGTVSIVVDEDDINTPWSQGTSPSDGSGDGSLTEGSTGAAIVTGSLAGLVSTGADEPGTFAFSADAIAQLTALGLFSKQTAQGDGQNGKPLFYQTSSGGPNEIVITGYEPNPSGNPVLSLTLNTVTGAYEFRLYDELIHVAGDGQNTDLRSGLPLDGIQASVPNIDFGSIITFTDRDGDQVTLSGKFTVTITDDVPQADIDIGHGSVTVDETPGNQADDTTSSSVRNLFANLEATFVDGVRLVGDDPDVAGDNNGGNSGNGAIAYAHSDFAVVVNDSVIGSDSPPYPHQFTLSVTNGNGTPSGLFVTDGSPINLSMKDGLVIGTVVGGQFDGKVAFAIAIGADGEVSVAQYLSIKHDDRGDSNESNDNGSNSNDASPDDPSTIQQTLNGKITATLTVTDSDGDQSSNSVNIGNLITFLDDGPSVDVKVVHDAHLIHDETPGIDAADDDVAGTTAFAGSTLASVFSAVDTPRGDDPHVADNPIGYALTSGAVFSFSTQNYGADGAAAVKPIQYELMLSSNNVHSGLKTTDGRDIHLFKEGNLIVGRYEVGGNNSPDGSPDEVAAFAISIDPATGQLAMVQYVSLDHPNDGNPDDTVQLDDGTLSVKVTLTDGDGDPASDTVDISCVIQFEDDGPTLVGSATLSIAVDEDGLATGNADAGRAGETLGTGSAVASGAAGALNALVNFGADGPGSAAFSLAVQSSPVNTGLESKGGDVFIVSDGTTLRGYVNLGGNSGYQAGTDREVFTLTVGSNGSYTFTLKDQIDHPSLNGWSGDNAENLLSSSIDLSKYIVATDGDGDSVKLGNGTFVVQIRDDIPIQTSGSVSGTVEEDDLNNAYSVGNNEDGSSGKTVATGSLTSLVKVGADENGTFALDSNGITALQGQNLTSHGTTLTYSISGDTLTAKAGALTVFTLQIQSNGSYTFTLKDQLDHAAGNGENTLSINLSSVVRFTDYDSDSVTLSGGFRIIVQDDVPTTASNTLVTVDEDDLAAGNHDAAAGDDVTPVSPVTGTLQFSVGADNPATVGFASLNGTAVLNTSGIAVTAAGVALVYLWDSSTNTLYATPDGTSAHAAFQIQVTNTATGAYSFSLLGPVDHPGHDADGQNNGPETAYEDNISINLTYTVTDRDGDFKTGTLSVSIDDDVPVLVQAPTNLIVNGDFSEGSFSSDFYGGYTSEPGGLTGWVFSNSTVDPAANLQVERVNDGYLGMHTSTLGSMIDLGASPGNIEISQQVSGLAAGQTYAIQFEAGAPYVSTAKLEVIWNNVVIGTIDPTGPMTSYSYVVTATGVAANDQITFREVATGGGDNHGTYLANVAVVATAVVDEDGLTGPLSVGSHDVQIGDAVDTNADGDANEATATGNLNIAWGADNADAADSAGALGAFVQDAPGGAGNRSVTFTDANVTVAGGMPLTSHGYSVSFVLSADNTVLSGTTTDGRTVFQVSLSDDGSGKFRFVLLDQLDHAPNGNENDISLTLNYTATDSDGDAANGKFVVSVDDDVPTAVAGATLTVLETDGATTGINLLANDTRGADGATVTAVNFGLGSGFQDIAAVGTTTITNVNGTYTFQANGTWTFDPSVNASNSNTTGNFTYRITDGDGDTSTAAQVVNITNANSIPTAGSKFLTVDEDGLPNGIAASQPGDVAASFITLSGTLGHNFGPDGPAASDPINFSPMDNGSHTTPVGISSGGVALKYYWDDAGDTLYASTNTTSLANAQSTAAFKVELNTATGGFTYTQLKPVDHPGHDADGANNGPETSYEDNLVVNLSYQVKDSNGDTATGTISVTINDDSPAAAPIVKTVTEGASDTNILLILDRSGSMGFDSGVSGYATRLDLLKAAANQLLDQYDAAGDVRVQIVKFNDNAQKQGSVWLSVADAKTYINGLTADDGTDYDDATALAPDAFDDPGKLTTPGVRNVSYFISDGQPEPTSEQVSGSELTDWINFVNANDIVSYAIGLGSSAPDTYLDPLAHDGRGTGSGTDTDALIVTDLNQLQSTLVGTVNPSISGSVIDGSIPTSFGADGGYVKSIAIDGKIYSYSPTSNSITELGSGQNAYSFNTATHKLTITFSGSAGESFVIDLDDGTYVYTPPTNIAADFSRPFTYTLTDNDGDTVSSTLTINIDNVNGAPVLDANASPFLVAITEDAVAPSGAVGTLVSSLVDLTGGGGINNVTDADGPGLGIAITGTNSANGTWFYSTNGGTTWTAVGAVSNSSALLLEANGDTRLYFQPAANFSGTVTDGITFRAWDETTGTAGTKVNTSTNGGSTAFSSATDTASVTVNAANDAPTIIAPNGGAAFSVSINENTTAVTDIDATDPDAGQTLTYSIVNTPGTDFSRFTINSSTGALKFTSAPNFEAPNDIGGTDNDNVYFVTVQVSDGNGGTDTQSITVTVNNVNEVTAVNDIIRTNFDGTAFNVPEWALLHNDTTESGSLDVTGVSNEDSLDVANPAGNVVNIDDGSSANGGSFDYTASNGTSTDTGSVEVFNKNGGGDVTGTASNEILVGDGDGDTFDGKGGVDIVFAGGGTDTIVADQNDYVMDGGDGTDTLRVDGNFTSQGNAQIVNVEKVVVNAPGLTLNLSNQTEGFSITANAGGGTIIAGTGGDTVMINAGITTTAWSIDLGIDSAADKIVFNHTSMGDTHNTVATVSHFAVANDKIAVTFNGAAVADGTFTTISAADADNPGEVIELTGAFTSPNLTLDGNGAAIETVIANAIDDIAAGTYTVIVYSNNTAGADAGIYTMNVGSTISGSGSNLGTGNFTLEHVMTLTGVGFGNLSDANFVATVDPIVLDLGQHGISFTSLENGVGFDINHDGVQDQIAWTANGEDGILAFDLDGSGKIEGGKELFTPNFNGGQFADGIAALASLDGNHDGVIDSQDQAFGDLVVWQDANHNGVSETGELATLGDLGVTSISLSTTPGGAPIDGQHIAGTGSFTYADGSTGTFVEVDLDASLGTASAQPDSHPAEDHDLSAFAAVAAEIDYGGGDIDLSGLQQPGADHAPAPQTQGAEAGHAGVDAGATTPAAITIMHEQAALAMQLAAS